MLTLPDFVADLEYRRPITKLDRFVQYAYIRYAYMDVEIGRKGVN